MSDIERIIKTIDWLIFKKKVKSRKELAIKMGYTESSISQILNSKVPLSERFIKKLSEIDKNINYDWLLTGNGSMLNEAVVSPVCNDVISMPREVFEQLSKLTESVLSQQRVIESQNGMLETLIMTNKKIAAQMENNATNAGAKEVSVA